MSNFAISKQWRIEQSGNQLIISGGSDAIYTIELESFDQSFFADASGTFSRGILSNSDRIVLEQLLSGAVVHPVSDVADRKIPNIKVVGNPETISAFIDTNEFFAHDETKKTDLLLLIRSTESFQEFLDVIHYEEVTTNHLFVDVAYHHVVSLGPLVFPGITSCVGCLKGRIASRWGDAQPPEGPAATQYMAFIREWVHIEIEKWLVEDDYTLVNKTIVWDANDRTMTHNKLLTVPLCPYHDPNVLLSSGKIDVVNERVTP